MLPVLILAGLAGNHFRAPFLLGSDLLFGSIAVMMIIQWYGAGWGIFAALVASSYTVVLYHHPWAMVTFTAEAAVVALVRQRFRTDLVVADTLFWFVAGMPFYFVVYSGVMHADPSSAIFVLTRNAANQILNALLARTLVILLSFTPLASPFGVHDRVSFRESLFTALACFVMIPALCIVVLNGRSEGGRVEREIRDSLVNVANQGKGILDAWMKDNIRTVAAVSAAIDPDALPKDTQRWLETIRAGSPGLLRLGVVSARGIVLAHDPPVDELGRSTIGVDVSSQPFVAEVTRRHALVTSDVVRSRLGRPDPIVILAYPVMRGDRYLGYIGGVIDLKVWDDLIDKVSGKWDMRATLVDRNMRVIACNRDDLLPMTRYDWREGGEVARVRDGLWIRKPLQDDRVPGTERIRNSVYLTEIGLDIGNGWKLVLETSMAPFQRELYSRYYNTLTALLGIFALALAGADVVSRRTVRSIERLDQISVGLQDRLARRETVDWPISRIAETGSLIGSFRAMAEALAARFSELAALNETLERRVEARTSELLQANRELSAEIEERKRVERARRQLEEDLLRSRKLESLGVLAGGIAHDFNNLLTAILGNITLSLTATKATDEIHRRLIEAEKASMRAQDLTQQLLTFSRGGAPIREAASIGDLVSDTAGFALRGSNVRLDYEPNPGLWPAEVDPGQISQVINNLIINASQAMPDGGTVTVRTGNEAVAAGDPLPLAPGDYVTISVSDQGVGIFASHLQRIFDPYFTTKQKGSGLGLATVYSIVKRHDGHIEVTSEPGRGATFKVWLPAAPHAKTAPREQVEELTQGNGRVLVMDDEPFVRDVIGAMLERLGYEPAFAEHGEEAIARYEEARRAGTPFDAVIMDLTVPGGMGGVEAARRLRELDPRVRIVVSSGYSNDPVMANFRDYGFVGVARKPFKVGELSRVMGEALAERRG
jgi:signal transduction histidine kinase/ActR/RegA family two-component response regulator